MVIDYPQISWMACDIQQTAVTHAGSGSSVDLKAAELGEWLLKRYAFTSSLIALLEFLIVNVELALIPKKEIVVL